MLLHDFVDYWARLAPEREFGVDAERTLNYGAAAAEVSRVAGALSAAGLAPNDRVAILARNRLEYPLFCFGASQAAVVPVTLNFRLAPEELQFILQDSGARLILVDEEFADKIEDIRGKLPDLAHAVCLGPDSRSGWSTYSEWLSTAAAASPEARATPLADACQIYTSGTTGSPKGVVHSHLSIFVAACYWRTVFPLASGERQLLVSPAFHSGGFLNFVHTALCGASVYALGQFDASTVVRLLESERIVRASLVPATLDACLAELQGGTPRDFGSLRYLSYGAAPITVEAMQRAIDTFACEIHQQFGQTEAPILTHLTASDHLRARQKPELLRSTGRAVMGCELRIVDDSNRPLPHGQTGEICARTPLIMKGYWKQDAATSETVRDGWIHTGDVGHLDAEGYLYIVDRKKDMIISGGENVYAREVEEVLQQHPAVYEAAVFGVPSERWGEEVRAAIVLKPQSVASEAELIEFCRPRIAGFKRPRALDFVAELPRNANGKVLKRALKEPHWVGHDRRVS